MLRHKLATAAHGFSPSDLPNLVGWYRYKRGIVTSGQNVTRWKDQSGLGHDLITLNFFSNKPTLQSDGINFALSTPGQNGTYVDMLRASFGLSIPVTVYILAKSPSLNGNTAGLFSGGNSSPANRFGAFLSENSTANDNIVMYNSGFDPQFGGYDLSNKIIIMGFVVNDAASLFEYFGAPSNSVIHAAGSPTSEVPNGFSLGTENSADFANAGHGVTFKEALIYNAAHDQTTRTKVFNYLNSFKLA